MFKKKAKKLRITDNYKHNAFDKRMMHQDSGIQTIIDNDYFENRDWDFFDNFNDGDVDLTSRLY